MWGSAHETKLFVTVMCIYICMYRNLCFICIPIYIYLCGYRLTAMKTSSADEHGPIVEHEVHAPQVVYSYRFVSQRPAPPIIKECL